MITREIIEAQLEVYQQRQLQATETFERAKATLNACIGAIEACQNLLRIHDDLKSAKSQESSE